MVEEETQTVQVRMGQIESLKHARENRCSLRIFTATGSASATTSDLSSAALDRLVDETVALARVTRRDEHAGLPAPEALAREVAELDLWDREGHGLPVEEKVERARRAEAAALDADPRIENSEGAEFYDRASRVAYAATGGFAGQFRLSSFALSVTPVAVAEGHMGRGYWYSSARKLRGGGAPGAGGPGAARRRRRAPRGGEAGTDGGPGGLRPGDGGQPCPRPRHGGLGPEPLPRHLVPGRPDGRAPRPVRGQ